jgi:hypothetical protein
MGRQGRGLAALLAALAFAPALPAQYWAAPPPRYDRHPPPPPVYGGPPPPDYYREPPGDPPPRSPRRYRRCRDDAGPSIIGAIAGGLLGNVIAGRGNRGIGTLAGAGAGALAGHAIGRNCR